MKYKTQKLKRLNKYLEPFLVKSRKLELKELKRMHRRKLNRERIIKEDTPLKYKN